MKLHEREGRRKPTEWEDECDRERGRSSRNETATVTKVGSAMAAVLQVRSDEFESPVTVMIPTTFLLLLLLFGLRYCRCDFGLIRWGNDLLCVSSQRERAWKNQNEKDSTLLPSVSVTDSLLLFCGWRLLLLVYWWIWTPAVEDVISNGMGCESVTGNWWDDGGDKLTVAREFMLRLLPELNWNAWNSGEIELAKGMNPKSDLVRLMTFLFGFPENVYRLLRVEGKRRDRWKERVKRWRFAACRRCHRRFNCHRRWWQFRQGASDFLLFFGFW